MFQVKKRPMESQISVEVELNHKVLDGAGERPSTIHSTKSPNGNTQRLNKESSNDAHDGFSESINDLDIKIVDGNGTTQVSGLAHDNSIVLDGNGGSDTIS